MLRKLFSIIIITLLLVLDTLMANTSTVFAFTNSNTGEILQTSITEATSKAEIKNEGITNPATTASQTTNTINNSAQVLSAVAAKEESLWIENFESAIIPNLPNGWFAYNTIGTSGTWNTNEGTLHPQNVAAHSGSNLAYFNSYSAADGDRTVLYTTKVTDMTALKSSNLYFWMYNDNDYSNYNDTLQVMVLQNGAAYWTNVGSVISRYKSTPGWYQYKISLDAYLQYDSLMIGFLATSAYGNDIHIDDVELKGIYTGGTAPLSPLGSGAQADPYIVNTAGNLVWLSINNKTDGFEGKYFKQTSDITLTGEWNPIGASDSQPFRGIFDGNGQNIYGITISNSSAKYLGLFGCNTGTIMNVGAYVAISGTGYSADVGGLVGYNGGTIYSSYIGGNISSTDSNSRVGGIAGYNNGQIFNCHDSTGRTAQSGKLGGITGLNSNSGIINNCTANANIAADNYGVIANSCVTGGSCTGPTNWGGISNVNYGKISNCYVIKDSLINTNWPLSTHYGGGLVGYNSGGSITNCFVAETIVTGSGFSYKGALVGRNTGIIYNCYYTTILDIHGIGNDSGSISGLIQETDISFYKTLSNYTNADKWYNYYPWDFTSTWRINPNINNGYPYLYSPSALLNANLAVDVSITDYNVKVVDRDSGIALTGAMVSVSGQSMSTSTNGYATISNISEGVQNVTVSYQGYNTFIADVNVNQSARTFNVYLEKESSDIKPYVSSALMTLSNKQYDIRNQKYSFSKFPNDGNYNGDKCDITIKVNWKGKTPQKVYISQGGDKKIESDNGIFANTDIGRTFDSDGKTIFIYAKASDGTISDIFNTQLKVNEASSGEFFPDTDGLNFKLGSENSVTISDDIPVFGGTELNLSFDLIPVSFELDDNKVKVVIGTKLEKDSKTGKWSADAFNFDKFKKDFKWGQNKMNRSLKQLRNDYKMQNNSFFDSKKVKTSVDVMGYAEYAVTDHGLDFLEGQIGIDGELKYSYQGQIFLGTFPFYYELGGGFGIGLEGNMIDLLSSEGFKPQLEADLKAKMIGELGAGVGIAKVATAGVKGEAQLNYLVRFRLNDISQKLDLDGTASFELKVLGCVIAEKEFAKGNYLIFETNNPNGLLDNNKSNISNENLYKSIDYNKPAVLENRDNINNPSEWLGNLNSKNSKEKINNQVSQNHINIESIPSINKETKVLQTNIYPDAKPIITLMGGKKVMLWIADNTERTKANKTMLVYSVFVDEIGTWSSPEPVLDNGMADYYPVAKEGIIAWQKAIKVFDDNTVTVNEIAQNSEIYTAVWNGDGFNTPERITNNDTLDTMPLIAKHGDENFSVVWVNNSNSDILGTTGKNTIMQRSFDLSWSSPSVVKDNLNAITDINAEYVADDLFIAYVPEQDNDLGTVNDRNIYLIKNGETTQITNNTYISSNPIFAKFGGNTALFWYDNGNIVYRADINNNIETKVFTEPKSGLSDTFSVMSNSKGQASILWTKVDNGGSEIQGAIFDGTKWSEDVKLSNTNALVKYPQGIMDEDGSLLMVFNRTIKIPNGDYYIDGASDLCTLKVIPSYNLSVTIPDYDEKVIVPNSDIPITINVTNKGELEVMGINVNVNNGNGTLNNTLELGENLKPGETKLLTAYYKVPSIITNQDITINVTPQIGQDYDNADNSAIINIGYSDVNLVKTELYSTPLKTTIYVTLSNENYLPASNVKVSIRDGSEYGKVICSTNVGVINKGINKVASFDIDPAYLNFDSNTKQLYVVADSDNELNTGNNSDYLLLQQEIAVTSIKLTSTSAAITLGQMLQMSAVVEPTDATDKNVTWSVVSQSAEDVITVSSEGIITGINLGTAVIRATSNSDPTKYAECTVTVNVDFNSDGKIDISDLILLINSYNSKKGDTNYNVCYDINSDGVIDIFDLVIISKKIRP